MSTQRRRFIRRFAATFGAIALIGLTWLVWFGRQKVKLVNAMTHVVDGNPTSAQLVAYLKEFENGVIVGNAMTLLEYRRDPAAVDEAARFLESDDEYVWFGAALYLGAVQDERAIPYLIKGFRHPATKSRKKIPGYLEPMTGEDLGPDQDEWIKWWREKHPDTAFTFKMDRP